MGSRGQIRQIRLGVPTLLGVWARCVSLKACGWSLKRVSLAQPPTEEHAWMGVHAHASGTVRPACGGYATPRQDGPACSCVRRYLLRVNGKPILNSSRQAADPTRRCSTGTQRLDAPLLQQFCVPRDI